MLQVSSVLEEAPLATLYGHTSPVTSCIVCGDLDLVVSASDSAGMLLHSLTEGRFVRRVKVASPVSRITMQGELVVVYCPADLAVHTITVNGAVIASATLTERCAALALGAGAMGAMGAMGVMGCVVLGGEGGTVWVLEAASLKVVSKMKTSTSKVTCIAEGKGNGTVFALGRENGACDVVQV